MTQFEKDLQAEYKDLFLQIRAHLLTYEGINETKKPRITTYANANGGLCHLRTMPHGVDIGFLKGSKMNDELGLLTGKGKAIRVVSFQVFAQTTIDYYMQQAIEINQKIKP
jgi:hypothetical protein